MAKRRRKERVTYKYECNLTGEQYTLTEKAKTPDDLMSVKAWYDMNPERDDRPEDVKKKLGLDLPAEEAPAVEVASTEE